MPDRVFIPLPGIGTLSLTRAEYEAALTPITPEAPKPKALPTSPPLRRVHSRTTPAKNGETGTSTLRYIRLREVCTRVGLRRSAIYRLIGLGRFPKQVKLSVRTVAWVESEVEAFLESRIEDRDRVPLDAPPGESPYMAWVESEVEAFLESRIEDRDRVPLDAPPGESPYMRMGEVLRRTGLSSSKIYELVREGTFPKWASLPKIASGWLRSDIELWIASRNSTS
jgi:prophage regulatory protein